MYVMCICIYNIRRTHVCIYTYLYTHTSANTHAHTHISTQIPEKDSNVLSQIYLKAISCFKITFKHYYDLPSAISNFCYTYAGCYENHELINYTVIPKSKKMK